MTLRRVEAAIEALAAATGRAVAWLTLAMVLTGTAVVALRYLFDTGFIWMQESLSWMHSAVFMLGAAYTLAADEHVRVDVLYRRLPERRQAVVELAGALLLLLPFCALLAWQSWPWVAASWRVAERSREAGGLSMLYLLKTLIPVMAALLAIQGLAIATRSWRRLRGGG